MGHDREVPIYFTIQPGGAYVQPSGAWLVYPNYQHKAPGTGVGVMLNVWSKWYEAPAASPVGTVTHPR